MTSPYRQHVCLLVLGGIYTLLLLQTPPVSAAACELEDRLTALEKQGREQALLLFQQGETIHRLNTELEKYKQQTEDQEKAIQQQERKITDQAASLRHHTTYIKQNQRWLMQYKTQLTMQTKRIKAFEEALNVDKLTLENQLTQNDRHDISEPPFGMVGETAGGLYGVISNQSTSLADKMTDQKRKVTSISKDTPTNTQKRLVLNDIEGSVTPVAFHATTDKGEVSHIGVNQNIALDVVLLNLGSGYHHLHGVFIAPVGGVYSISASILTTNHVNHPEIRVSLLKNGEALGRAYGHADDGRHDQGAITVVTQLVKGDEVWLADIDIADASYWGARFTSFSGHLLFEV